MPEFSMKALISWAFQTVVRGPSLTGLGKRPVRQPSHHALLLMGMIARIWGRRRKPIEGIGDCCCDIKSLVWLKERKKRAPWTPGQRSSQARSIEARGFQLLLKTQKTKQVVVHPRTKHYLHDLLKVNRSFFPVCLSVIVQYSLPPRVTHWKIR